MRSADSAVAGRGNRTTRVCPGGTYVADVVLTTTRLLIVPAGTPEEIVGTLEAAVQELIADPAYQAKAEERQVGINFRDSEEGAQVWQSIDENFGPIVAEFRGQ